MNIIAYNTKGQKNRSLFWKGGFTGYANPVKEFMNNLRYAYLGDFECVSNTIDIADPHINVMSALQEKIPSYNEQMVKIRKMINGYYHCYHIVDSVSDSVLALCAIHNSYNEEDLYKCKKVIDRGCASSLMSSAIVIVDERYRFDTKYCYYAMDDDAVYDGNLILKELPNMKYSEETKEQLKNMVNKVLSEDKNPTGKQITDIVQNAPIWEGFRNFGNRCSMWSVEIEKSLYDFNDNIHFPRYRNSVPIKGGIASMADSGLLKCTEYHDQQGNVFGVVVNLCSEERE